MDSNTIASWIPWDRAHFFALTQSRGNLYGIGWIFASFWIMVRYFIHPAGHSVQRMHIRSSRTWAIVGAVRGSQVCTIAKFFNYDNKVENRRVLASVISMFSSFITSLLAAFIITVHAADKGSLFGLLTSGMATDAVDDACVTCGECGPSPQSVSVFALNGGSDGCAYVPHRSRLVPCVARRCLGADLHVFWHQYGHRFGVWLFVLSGPVGLVLIFVPFSNPYPSRCTGAFVVTVSQELTYMPSALVNRMPSSLVSCIQILKRIHTSNVRERTTGSPPGSIIPSPSTSCGLPARPRPRMRDLPPSC
jgi:hypothetical protein